MYFEELEKQYVENGQMFREFVENRFFDLKNDSKFFKEVAENYNSCLVNTIDYLNKNKHYFHNVVFRQIRRDYDGIADKKRLVSSLYRRLKDGMMDMFLNTLNYRCFRELNEVQYSAYVFTLAYAHEIVNWLGRNVCVDLYDLIATKKGYERMKKFVHTAEGFNKESKPELNFWPKQWN